MRLSMKFLMSIFLALAVFQAFAGFQYTGEPKTGVGAYAPVAQCDSSTHGNDFRSSVESAVESQNSVYQNAWSGSRQDLDVIVKKAEQEYGFESSKHLGRNATMLIPATLREMRKEIDLYGNADGWGREDLDLLHQPDKFSHSNVKYTTLQGDSNKQDNDRIGGEVVYNEITGEIVADEYMGTRNFFPLYRSFNTGHISKDMWQHVKANQYKYVGILYERDPNNPDKYYIIDGQTGLPMTPQEVAEMPTTLSDMWKGMGLVCVASDTTDIVDPETLKHSDDKIAERCDGKDSLSMEDVINALREDGTGAALATALLGEDDSKVEEAMRNFNKSLATPIRQKASTGAK